MTAKAAEDSVLPAPLRLCHGASRGNGTCAAQMSHFLPPYLSSTFALVVLAAMLVGIILVSLATFHFHKRKLRKRKIQRAQEEYERDSRSPVVTREPVKPCVIVRQASRDTEPSSGAAASPRRDAEKPNSPAEESAYSVFPPHDASDEDVSPPGQAEGPALRTVVSS